MQRTAQTFVVHVTEIIILWDNGKGEGSCPCASLLKHYAMKAYGVMDV
jgi:hypothetical protein